MKHCLSNTVFALLWFWVWLLFWGLPSCACGFDASNSASTYTNLIVGPTCCRDSLHDLSASGFTVGIHSILALAINFCFAILYAHPFSHVDFSFLFFFNNIPFLLWFQVKPSDADPFGAFSNYNDHDTGISYEVTSKFIISMFWNQIIS